VPRRTLECRPALGTKISELQDMISQYDPVALLHRAAYVLLPLFIKYRSENEYSAEEAFFIPGVEYLQYLVARTEVARKGREPTEDDWSQLWSLTIEVLRLTQTYLFTRKTVTPRRLRLTRFGF
jgi:hypothetical protein